MLPSSTALQASRAVDGPVPNFKKYASLDEQIDALGKQVVRWVRDERVKASDICILYNGKNIKWRLEQQVAPMLRDIGSGLTFVGEQGWKRSEDAVLASTSHAYKGFDSEVVVIAGVEQFIASPRGILAPALYVAMTRARSLLAVYAYARKNPAGGQRDRGCSTRPSNAKPTIGRRGGRTAGTTGGAVEPGRGASTAGGRTHATGAGTSEP